MIFVAVGSSTLAFDRLVATVGELTTTERVVVQHGVSRLRPPNAECVDFLGYGDFLAHVQRARIVITHAGAGSLLTALAEHKRPIVVPRRKRFGEAVDDHQVPFAHRAAALGLVSLVEDVADLPAAVRDATGAADAAPPGPSAIARDLRPQIAAIIERRMYTRHATPGTGRV